MLSWISLTQSARNLDLIRYASRLERRETATVAADDARLRKAWAVGSSLCDDAVNRAAATISLRAVASRDPSRDFSGWWDALSKAEDVLVHMAGCSPHDGNVWANLALVRRAIVVPSEATSQLVHLSEQLSPSELHTINTRIEIWRSLPDEGRRLLADVQERDVARIRNHGWREDVEGLAQRLGEPAPSAEAPTPGS